MTNPPFKVPQATVVYDVKGRPIELRLDGADFPAPLSGDTPLSVDFLPEGGLQVVTATFFVRGFATIVDERTRS